MGLGGAVFVGNSKLLEGPLGVIQVGFKGYDLGKTTADANLVPEQDIKDILYQQDGTKPADHVRTGIDLMLNVTFGKISTGLLELLMAGISTQNTTPTEDTGTIDRVIYQSMRDNEGGVLRVAAVDVNGHPLEDVENLMNFYEAIPIVNGDLVNWGADTQRNFPVTFKIKWHEFSEGESASKDGAFGYWGSPVTEDVPAIVWPDVEAPKIVSAIVTANDALDIYFDKAIVFQVAWDALDYAIKVDGKFYLTSGGSIDGVRLTLNEAVSALLLDSVVEVYINEHALEDAAANAYPGCDACPVTGKSS